jgi:hypothetical protein
MKRVLVNIISKQTMPNFLFIKEMIQSEEIQQSECSLLFISSGVKEFEDRIDYIEKALGYSLPVDKIILKKGEEENEEKMSASICTILSTEVHYSVNLTGGTKYMALVVHAVFTKFCADFYYIPFPKNVLLNVFPYASHPLKTRLTVDDYMNIHGLKYKCGNLSAKEEHTNNLFYSFVNNKLRNDLISLLREKYRRVKKKVCIHEMEKGDELNNMIKDIGFLLQEEGYFDKHEIQYLTGGWFEEYVYNKISKSLEPQDIKLNVQISYEEKPQSELDVVFTYENKLFVVECKTELCVDSENKTSNDLFIKTVYKSTAIKEVTLFGLSTQSFIFSLSEGQPKSVADKAMKIKYYDRSFFIDDKKFEELIAEIKRMVKD